MDRIQTIRTRLTEAFAPTQLEIIDDSQKHIGHAGSQSGAGHFSVHIASPMFTEKSLVACHQMIYKALDGLIGPEIHALQIKIIST